MTARSSVTPEAERTGRRLDAIRDDALALAERLSDDIRAVSEAREASNVDDEHDPEGSTIAYERSQLEAIRRSALERAADAYEARRRLADGRYGICVRCGRPVPAARLEARPTASVCLDCAV
ncbi:General stress protein 16O [Frondihabitans sp. 762G35]|uniref:TraR/DksA family transcriptional regulator n=1 Tax=Frondihabitans sp. 762G35 TaxID=1446794 RepID=UPI000D20A643|nr:TraR/DksA family transcriptional regulator [Frondihabitans sp. 762G35]ARC57140.1 General stress protein 16O [Frondihabitans sp. 762G35]